ncbi:E3 ubiquitin/ISG15 ligase TRIM25-like [Petromyzon marinus]|uniref:E3 ubiquitin/ISG15 ligase TRIM25-like n=1 Tax=Petromyzon marinus TaxID=7757 RepID=A0AAJ7T5U4_PETMA|nr:E3 ubiquitin/ISG15 ligase TRIM25-like [Petromyzon marinus]XP_032811379.1 E3 ubiquitin/ISG15 ligase TRIM25-like [Petromyzon marinus]
MAASKDQLENELTCPICFQYYRDPVILNCKHSFCRECILKTWEHGPSNCPHCRMLFFFMDRQEMERKLEKNFQLANIVESFASLKLSTPAPKPAPKKKKSSKSVASVVLVPKDVSVNNTPIMCDWCVGAKRQAVKTCQLCAVSMCQEHLEPHLVNVTFRHHILVKPCKPVKHRLCPEHREPLKMYCTQDNACVCTVCCIAGKHRGHELMPIDEFATSKKAKLYSDLQNLNSAKGTDSKKLDILKKTEENVKKASVDFKKKITSSLEAAVTELQTEHGRIQQLAITEESHVLQKITRQISQREKSIEETLAINGEVQALMRHEDDITFLEESQAMEERIKKAMKSQPEAQIVTKDLFANLKGSIAEITSQITEWKDRNQMMMSFRNIAVDSDTAHFHLEVAKDRKKVCLPRFQNRKEIADIPQRFSFWRQALSCESFTFGQHYWEVGVEESNEWAVGVAYSSLPRKGKGALIELGGNDKSWCLENNSGAVTVNHRADKETLQINDNLKRIGVLLNCDKGTVAFYNVCLVKTHLHTFSTAFTEPVFAAFKVMSGTLTMCSP